MSALIPYTNLSVVTQPQIAQRDPIQAIKPTDQTNNTITFTSDSALAVAVAANATYRFDLGLHYSTPAAANLNTQWTFPAGLGMHFEIVGMASGASVLNIFVWDQASPFALSGNAPAARFTGFITVASTPGTLQLQWAQATANAGPTKVQANSYLILYQVA